MEDRDKKKHLKKIDILKLKINFVMQECIEQKDVENLHGLIFQQMTQIYNIL